MAVVEFRNEQGVLEYHINDILSSEGFDNLLDFFTSIECGCLLEIKQGPGTKLALIEFGVVKIQLVFSDQIGNYYYAIDYKGNRKAKELARALEKRIEVHN